MAADALDVAPKGSWERAATNSYGWLLFLALLAGNVLTDLLGFWPSTALTVGVLGLGALLLVWRALPERRQRLARDAERGIIECAIRYPDSLPGSHFGQWLPGFAEIDARTVRLQPDMSGAGNPAGRIRPFNHVSFKGPVELPAKRPREFKRGWQIVALETSQGLLHVATGDVGRQLLEDRLRR